MNIKDLVILLQNNKKKTGIRRQHLLSLGVLDDVLNHTKFLDSDYELRERIYCVVHEITEKPICKICGVGTHLDRVNARKGFHTYCSAVCYKKNQGKDGAEVMKQKACQPGFKESHANKINIGVKKKYGVSNPMELPRVAAKTKKPKENKVIPPYLTEGKLCSKLKELFGVLVTTQVILKDEERRYRVDAFINTPEGVFVVEFDGHYHYNEISNAFRDIGLKQLCERNGWKLIQVPFFVQLNESVMLKLFGEVVYTKYIQDKIGQNDYPHGFIDLDCRLPGDFTEYGWIRFFEEIQFFDIIEEVRSSVEEKARVMGGLERVMGILDPKIFGYIQDKKLKFLGLS